MITCGTCKSTTFILSVFKDVHLVNRWQFACSNGHVWYPVPGEELVISVDRA